jgi:restriction system protein
MILVIEVEKIGFEQLVVSLLDKMGYGGQIKDAGQVTQKSNDGGIDGIVKEDVLGLGRIQFQAKRYARDNSIGREDVQKIVGALAFLNQTKACLLRRHAIPRALRNTLIV